ncbi:hypothetical protein [Campylobacter upsaliensis]|uniref:hypothetical protein n=1 Tax=Campylobacter upsaliensis TaxID=28080 RepID=UPI0022EB0101|nr:hypothetical protein [Campylobacter upsaliensis]
MKTKLERILDNTEKLLGSSLVSFLALISYLFINFESLNSVKTSILLFAIFCVFVLCIVLIMFYLKFLKRLS